jgi:hypothetical protein
MTDATLQKFAAPTLADMRQALAGECFAGRVRHCVDGVWCTLEVAGNVWRLDLLSAGQCLTERRAREFYAAAGAPATTYLAEAENGAKWAAVWEVD